MSSTINTSTLRRVKSVSHKTQDNKPSPLSNAIIEHFGFEKGFTIKGLWKAAVVASNDLDTVAETIELALNSPTTALLKLGKSLWRSFKSIFGSTKSAPKIVETESEIKEKEEYKKEFEKAADPKTEEEIQKGIKEDDSELIFDVLEFIVLRNINEFGTGLINELVTSFTPINLVDSLTTFATKADEAEAKRAKEQVKKTAETAVAGKSDEKPATKGETAGTENPKEKPVTNAEFVKSKEEEIKQAMSQSKQIIEKSVDSCLANNPDIRGAVHTGIKSLLGFFRNTFGEYKKMHNIVDPDTTGKTVNQINGAKRKRTFGNLVPMAQKIGKSILGVITEVMKTFKGLFVCFGKAYVANAANLGGVLLKVAVKVADGLIKSLPIWAQITGLFNWFLHHYRTLKVYLTTYKMVYVATATAQTIATKDTSATDSLIKLPEIKGYPLPTLPTRAEDKDRFNNIIKAYMYIEKEQFPGKVRGIGVLLAKSIVSGIKSLLGFFNVEGLFDIINTTAFVITAVASKVTKWMNTNSKDKLLDGATSDSPINPAIMDETVSEETQALLDQASKSRSGYTQIDDEGEYDKRRLF